jgi:hypothetical protein
MAGWTLANCAPTSSKCRAGLSLRAVFWCLPDGLWISLIGNHDDVKKYLRAL